MRKKDFKFFFEENRKFIRITGHDFGVVYFIKKGNRIELKDSFGFEADQEGRCIGFDGVEEKIDLKEFDERLKEFAQKRGWAVIERG